MRAAITHCAGLVCMIGAILSSGCSSDLSRSRVKSILSEQPLFTKPVPSSAWRAGGYQEWMQRGGMNNSKLATGILTADGATVTFSIPIHRAIDEVTGITEAPLMANVKAAEFQWSLAGVPQALRRLIVAGGRGRAYFAKYDDGWRVDNSMTALTAQTNLFGPPEALAISPNEQNEIAADIAVERQRATAAATKRKARLAESHTASIPPVAFNSQFFRGAEMYSGGTGGWVTEWALTDVALHLTRSVSWVSGMAMSQSSPSEAIWMGRIASLSIDDSRRSTYIPLSRDVGYCSACTIIMTYTGGSKILMVFHKGGRDLAYQKIKDLHDRWRARFGDLGQVSEDEASEAATAALISEIVNDRSGWIKVTRQEPKILEFDVTVDKKGWARRLRLPKARVNFQSNGDVDIRTEGGQVFIEGPGRSNKLTSSSYLDFQMRDNPVQVHFVYSLP